LAAKSSENIKKLILLNPSIVPPSIDINKINDMPKRILKEMLNKSFFEDKFEIKIYILLGTEDDVVPNSWSIEFAKAQEANVLFLNDDHSFSKNLNKLPSIIKNILNQKN
jgi:alpha/beta superfamily hydrolase